MNFPNNCLAKSFEIFQKSLAKSKNYSPKNLWKYMDTEHIYKIPKKKKTWIFQTIV